MTPMRPSDAERMLREYYEPALACQLDGENHSYEWWRQFYAIPRGTIEVCAEDGTLLGHVRQDDDGWWNVYPVGQPDRWVARSPYWDLAVDVLLYDWPSDV